MYIENSDLSLTGVTFDGNSADSGGGMSITSGSSPLLTDVVFINNTSTVGGGGINISNSTPALTDVIIDNNVSGVGGGVYLSASSNPSLTNVTITGNGADYGGGIYAAGNSGFSYAYLTIRNSTISNNGALTQGGGIYNSYGELQFINVTLADNTAGASGGGLYNTTSAVTFLTNTLVSNSSGGDCVNVGGSGTVGWYSLIEDAANACGLINGTDGNIVGSDPLLGPLQNNGGTTETHKPLANSPVINRGTNNSCPATDQIGTTRPQGGTCDIGAVEIPITSLTVKSLDTKDGHVLESGENTNVGGSILAAGTTFHLGDDAAKKQYIAILHFDTSSIPDTAVITTATLKIKKYATVGTDPFTILGNLTVDMRRPSFGADLLSINDFQIVAGRVAVATFGTVPVSNWYSAALNGSGRNYLSKTSTTQFRLRFATDDNNNAIADYMLFYSGDHGNSAVWPQLIIEYYVP
jgi:predicted outer membrane repeat protein